ncbi:unnamed protein product [Symbiodinium natans]|uniref:PPM-type phosphatase domain-containing protein n=1 Tax=Symbiodinium natans TaxID=878477 RepID=A0A812TK68_9DINO|nr:unnamed protein product [Symbiodinium natans]
MSDIPLPGSQSANARHWEDKPNAGYSGTPMWKIKAQLQEQQANAQAGPRKVPEGFKQVEKGKPLYYNDKRQVYWNCDDGLTYAYDAVMQKYSLLYDGQPYDVRIAVGACFHEKASQVRHVLVRDLAKAAQAMRMSIEHLDRPCAMYALYEGHRGRPSSGTANACAEFCVKHLHQKLLPKLAAFRGFWEDTRLEVAMRESFEELDAEFTEKHPGVPDGCCATVALVSGHRVVITTLGDVAAVVCMRNGEALEFLKPHVAPGFDEDDDEDDEVPQASQGLEGESLPIQWTRSLGDADLKKPNGSTQLSSTPDIKVLHLEPQHLGIAFVCRALYNAIGKSTAVSTVSKRCAPRARMAAGALVDAAVQWLGQVGDLGLGSIVVFFDRIEDGPAHKRAKKEEPSQVRLRHILLKHRECKSTIDKVRNKQVKRSRGEAERLLRAVLEECQNDPGMKIFTQRCKELSECQSCLKAGELVGDLSWVKPGKYGQAFAPWQPFNVLLGSRLCRHLRCGCMPCSGESAVCFVVTATGFLFRSPGYRPRSSMFCLHGSHHGVMMRAMLTMTPGAPNLSGSSGLVQEVNVGMT